MSEIWIAAAAAATVGTGVAAYGAEQAGTAGKAGQRNFGGEVGSIFDTANNQRSADGSTYASTSNQNLASGLLGGLDVDAFLSQHPEFQEGFNNNGGDKAWLARAIQQAGYIDPSTLPRGGGLVNTLSDLQGRQDISNADSSTYQRTRNLQDMGALAPGAAQLRRQLNPEYFSALGAVNNAAGAPINASPYETAFGAKALSSSPTFALGGAAPRRAAAPASGRYAAPVREATSGAGVNMISSGAAPAADGAAAVQPSSSAAIDKWGNPMAETQQVSDGGVNMASDPSSALGSLGDDMRMPGQEPPPANDSSQADPGQMDLGQVDENVAGPGRLTRQLTRSATDTSPGTALGLEGTLGKQAADALAQGGELSAQEQRDAQASAAAGAAGRGLGDTNSALAAEVLNLDSAKRARLDSNRAFASGVDSQLRSGQAADRGYGLSLDAANLSRTGMRQSAQQNNISNRLNAASFNAQQRAADLAALGSADSMYRSRGTESFNRLGTAAQLSSANLYDPSSVLGTTDNRLNSTTTLQLGAQYTTPQDYTNSLLSYGSDLYGQNANANSAAAIARANAYAALGGGLISAAGKVGGAYAGGG